LGLEPSLSNVTADELTRWESNLQLLDDLSAEIEANDCPKRSSNRNLRDDDDVTRELEFTADRWRVQRGGLRLTRVRGVPLTSETLGFGDLIEGHPLRDGVP